MEIWKDPFKYYVDQPEFEVRTARPPHISGVSVVPCIVVDQMVCLGSCTRHICPPPPPLVTISASFLLVLIKFLWYHIFILHSVQIKS